MKKKCPNCGKRKMKRTRRSRRHFIDIYFCSNCYNWERVK